MVPVAPATTGKFYRRPAHHRCAPSSPCRRRSLSCAQFQPSSFGRFLYYHCYISKQPNEWVDNGQPLIDARVALTKPSFNPDSDLLSRAASSHPLHNCLPPSPTCSLLSTPWAINGAVLSFESDSRRSLSPPRIALFPCISAYLLLTGPLI